MSIRPTISSVIICGMRSRVSTHANALAAQIISMMPEVVMIVSFMPLIKLSMVNSW